MHKYSDDDKQHKRTALTNKQINVIVITSVVWKTMIEVNPFSVISGDDGCSVHE